MKGFIEFVRTQGVVGLAVGFILGGSVKSVVTALVDDLITPILAPLLGSTKGLNAAVLNLGPISLMYGHFLGVLIDFAIIAAVVYFIVKGFGFDKIDKPK